MRFCCWKPAHVCTANLLWHVCSPESSLLFSAASGMARGYPLLRPNPWLALATGFGMTQLMTLAYADHLLPDALRTLYYGVIGDNPTARFAALVVWAVHAVEAGAAISASMRQGFAIVPTLYYALLSFLLGFPGLTLVFRNDEEEKVKPE